MTDFFIEFLRVFLRVFAFAFVFDRVSSSLAFWYARRLPVKAIRLLNVWGHWTTEGDFMLRRHSILALIAALTFSSAAFATSPTTAPTAAPAAAPADTEIELNTAIELVPVSYRHRLVQQLSLAEDNQQTWLKAIVDIKPEHREALAYLLINMPEGDLKSMKGSQLITNIDLAYTAREQTAWAKAIPQELFFRDVLPYANVDETREDWRQDYYDRFMPLVKDAKSASEAEQILNKKVFPMVKVKYHATKRERPNQSPSESTKIGYASCTGLSIILSDACRAVGVPARLAGTPLWTDENGNHTWTEVWDKQWYYVGSAEPGKLNHTWFTDKAAKADDSKAENRIYAASFEMTPTVFPLVWDETQTQVRAQDVTGYYTARQALTITAPANTSVELRQKGILVAAAPSDSATFDLPAGQEYAISLLDSTGKVIEFTTVKTAKDAATTLTVPAKK
jgi:hypothetical protein